MEICYVWVGSLRCIYLVSMSIPFPDVHSPSTFLLPSSRLAFGTLHYVQWFFFGIIVNWIFFPIPITVCFFIVITFSCGHFIPRLSLIVSCAVVCMFALQNYHLSLTIDILVFFLHFCDFFSHGCSVYVFPSSLSPKWHKYKKLISTRRSGLEWEVA